MLEIYYNFWFFGFLVFNDVLLSLAAKWFEFVYVAKWLKIAKIKKLNNV
jgi:hypothetical protein